MHGVQQLHLLPFSTVRHSTLAPAAPTMPPTIAPIGTEEDCSEEVEEDEPPVAAVELELVGVVAGTGGAVEGTGVGLSSPAGWGRGMRLYWLVGGCPRDDPGCASAATTPAAGNQKTKDWLLGC